MGSGMDKAKGHANETVGNVKQAAGKATGSERLQAEGMAQEIKGEGQEIKGEGQKAMGKAKETVKKATDL